MNAQKHFILYRKGSCLMELPSAIEHLKRESGEEFLYTTCGQRIGLHEVVAINGIAF